jgi:hypothetical protein
MKNINYFKRTFAFVVISLTIGFTLYGLFKIGINDSNAIGLLLLESLATAMVTGLILGLMNMYFRIDFFQKAK